MTRRIGFESHEMQTFNEFGFLAKNTCRYESLESHVIRVKSCDRVKVRVGCRVRSEQS